MLQQSQLESLAQTYKTRVIYKVEQVEQEPWLFGTDKQKLMDERTHRQVILCGNGRIYTCTNDFTTLSMAQKLLNSETNIPVGDIEFRVCSKQVIDQLFRRKTTDLSDKKQDAAQDRSDAQSFMDTLVEDAVQEGATDIHMDVNVSTGQAKIHFRVSGLLRLYQDHVNNTPTWDSKVVKEACSAAINADAAKHKGTKKEFNAKKTLDASLPVQTTQGSRFVRYAHVPSIHGFKVVLRIFSSDANEEQNNVRLVEDLGYLKEQAEIIEDTSIATSGLVFISGPTGSGKSTLLYATIQKIPETKAVYTKEDPVENIVSNAVQVPVDPDDPELDWEALSKNILRMDPDVIMYGELRDPVVAGEIVNAATTGHLVFSTLHTSSAVGCITRLNDLGISHSRMAEPGLINALVFQRLIPKVCSECAVKAPEYQPVNNIQRRQMERLTQYFQNDWQRILIADTQSDCAHCQGTGVSGRLLIAEVIEIDDAARGFIANQDTRNWLKHLKQTGWQDVADHASKHIIEGRACPLLTESIISARFKSDLNSELLPKNSTASHERSPHQGTNVVELTNEQV